MVCPKKITSSISFSQKPSYPFCIFILIWFFVSSGCNTLSSSPSVIPTNTKTVDEISAELFQPIVTISPIITPLGQLPSPTTQSLENIDLFDYHHPDGLFILQVPVNWSQSYNQNSATFNSEKQASLLHVEVINSGYKLDQEALKRFVKAREMDTFRGYDYYHEKEEFVNEVEGFTSIKKEFKFNSEEITAITIYDQRDLTVLIVDFWTVSERFDLSMEKFERIIDSIDLNPEAAANLDLYAINSNNRFSNGFFSIQIPSYWAYSYTSGSYSVVNTFYSPDQKAVIQTASYDDGEFLPKSVSGELVLSILQEQYTNDLFVISDTLRGDREYLVWKSFYSNYQGVTLFETRNNALMMLTVMWENDSSDIYQGMLENIIDSYQSQETDNRD